MVFNKFYHGDNLKILSDLAPKLKGKIQLAYLDPPFLSGTDRKHSGKVVYKDKWRSTEEYLTPINSLLEMIHPLLKQSGVLFLHCDFRMSHRLRLITEEIFGEENYINEVIWSYRTGGVPSKVGFARKHDTIHVFAKDLKRTTWNQLTEKSYLAHKYGFSNITLHKDEKGIYRETVMRDVWDIPALRGNSPEKVAYPTQKPEELLERIILTGSTKGDLVLDPFSGSGTTASVSNRLNRKWIVIDKNKSSGLLVKKRISL